MTKFQHKRKGKLQVSLLKTARKYETFEQKKSLTQNYKFKKKQQWCKKIIIAKANEATNNEIGKCAKRSCRSAKWSCKLKGKQSLEVAKWTRTCRKWKL